MKQLIRNLLQPVITRVGTALGAFLLGHGMPAETVAQIETALLVLVLFVADLFMRHFLNRARR